MRRFDHIDLRVTNMAEAEPFYTMLLPELGFTREEGTAAAEPRSQAS